MHGPARLDASPRRDVVALLLGLILALAVVVGLASHHDEAAGPADAAPNVALAVLDAFPAEPADDDLAVACSILALCAVAVIAVVLAARRRPSSGMLSRAEPRDTRTASAAPPRVPPVSLDALSISRV